MNRILVILLACSALALLGVERPPGLGDVLEVRHWSYADYTRVVVELSRPVNVDRGVRRLPANAGADRPDRLYLDLPRIWVGKRYREGLPVGDGLLQGVRLGQNTLSTSRLVIDLEQYEWHRLLVLRAPHRVVVDVYGHRHPRRRTDKPSPGSGLAESAFRLSLPLRPVHTVVIDPGHGGKDPGAVGLAGILEKDINLKFAKILAKRLDEQGFRPVLTRHDDRYLDLEERTAIAESARGDLFISIHANASRRRATRGLEIYTLDETHERHSLGVAARENSVSVKDLNSLQRVLARLRVAEASDHSARLAELVHAAIISRMSGRHRGFQDLGIKKGPFYVLFLSSMPSILVETGFITNRGDVKLLRDASFQDTLAKQIAMGLIRYREGAETLATGVGG